MEFHDSTMTEFKNYHKINYILSESKNLNDTFLEITWTWLTFQIQQQPHQLN